MALVAWAFYAKADTATEPADSRYEDQFVVQQYVAYRKQVPNSVKCSCVQYAKWYLGVPLNEYWGNAWQIKPSSPLPYVGGLVLTNEGQGHLAVITAINGDLISITEGNYKSCQVTTRVLNVNNPVIRGYK